MKQEGQGLLGGRLRGKDREWSNMLAPIVHKRGDIHPFDNSSSSRIARKDVEGPLKGLSDS
jgi:hypothetical protein